MAGPAGDRERFRLGEEDHQRLFETGVVPQVFTGVRPSERPVAIIFGGQPGSGKSPLLDAAVDELEPRGGAALIIGDDLRGFHPLYRQLLRTDDKTAAFYTDLDSGRWVEKAIQFAKAQRLNVIIESTMRDPEVFSRTSKAFREAGYQVEARVLAVHERLSWQGVLQRYEAQKAARGSGRMTAPHSHRDAYEGAPKTVERIEAERLADRLVVVRRGGAVLYANQLADGQWKQRPRARAALEAERARPMTLDEHQAYVAGYERLAAMLAKPQRQAERDEVAKVQDLRDQARRGRDAHVLLTLPRASALHLSAALKTAYDFLDALAVEISKRGITLPDAAAGLDLAKAELAQRIAAGSFVLERPADHDIPRDISRDNSRDIDR